MLILINPEPQKTKDILDFFLVIFYINYMNLLRTMQKITSLFQGKGRVKAWMDTLITRRISPQSYPALSRKGRDKGVVGSLQKIVVAGIFLCLPLFSFSQEKSSKEIGQLKKGLKEKEEKIQLLEKKLVQLEKILEGELKNNYQKIEYLQSALREKERIIQEKENRIEKLKLILDKAIKSLDRLLEKLILHFRKG